MNETRAQNNPIHRSLDEGRVTREKDDQQHDESNEILSNFDQERPIVVLVNPHSGKGKSLLIYRKKIQKYFKTRDIPYETFVTESDVRVNDFIKSKSLSELTKFKTILVVSGDGLLHETINAIMGRPDWEKVMKIPVGIVPTGSGNGLAYTLIRQNNPELNDLDEVLDLCLDQAVCDSICEADLVKVTYGQNNIYWSFLSIGWGLLADIDVDSDWLRPLGEWRFTLYGVLRSFTSTSYKCELSYVLARSVSTPDSEDKDANFEKNETWVRIEDKFACIYAVHQSYVSRVTRFAPQSTLTDQLIYLTYIRGKLSICRVVEFLLAIEDGSHDKLSYVTVVRVSKFNFQPLEAGKVVIDGETIPWKVGDGALSAEVIPKAMRLRWNEKK